MLLIKEWIIKNRHKFKSVAILFIVTLIVDITVFLLFSVSLDAQETLTAREISLNSLNNTTNNITSVVFYDFDYSFTRSEMANNASSISNLGAYMSPSEDDYFGHTGFNFYSQDFLFIDFDNSSDMKIIISPTNSITTENDGTIIHSYTNLPLCFDSSQGYSTDYTGFDNFCFITDIHADYLLEENERFSDCESYDDLIGNYLEVISSDGVSYKWKISNIIIDSNDTYKLFNGIYGNYILAYTNTGYYNFSITYNFGHSDNANLRYLNNIKNIVPYDCEIAINDYNLLNKNNYSDLAFNIDEIFNNANNYNTSYVYAIGVVLCLFNICFILSVGIYTKNNLTLFIPTIFGFLISYCIFWIMANSYYKYYLFFSISSIAVLLTFMILTICIGLVYYFKFYKRSSYRNKVVIDEQNI